MAIHQYFDASTAHITEEDAEMLTLQSAAVVHGSFIVEHKAPLICDYPDGFFFFNPYKEQPPEEVKKDILTAGYSESLVDVLEYAFVKLKTDYVRLDIDGDIIDELKVHEW